ncbi:hypothetical protein NFI08_12345 [Halomonas sp. EF61]|uniref:hypothetical protein n=1 Tax=Halomonas sp. EF61 TaxID=2950869 RepID=UPI0032DE919F
MEEEQNGLELVFKGVTVEMLLQEPDDYESYGVVPTQGQWDIVRERSRQLPRTLSILVTVPDLDEMEIGITLEHGEGINKDNILKKHYIKSVDYDTLIDRKTGRESGQKKKTGARKFQTKTTCISYHQNKKLTPAILDRLYPLS